MGNTVFQVGLSLALLAAGGFVAAASFGGASLLASSLISAGVSGATSAISNHVSGRPSSWKEWAQSTGVGLVTGFAGGCIGAGAGAMAKGATEAVTWSARAIQATQSACIMGGSMTASVACNSITNVLQGRKPFEGWGIALATGVVGGAFACGSTALASNMKNSAVDWFKLPIVRHSAGVAVDTMAGMASGVVAAFLSGQDIGTAVLTGLATGVTVGAVVAGARSFNKNRIRRGQRREESSVEAAIEDRRRNGEFERREVNGITFDFEDSLEHRDFKHLNKHHRDLKDRLEQEPNCSQSSRFKDRATAECVRASAIEEAASRIVIPEDVQMQQNSLRALKQQRAAAETAFTDSRGRFLLNKSDENKQLMQAALAHKKAAASAAFSAHTDLQSRLNETRFLPDGPAGKFTIHHESPDGLGYAYSRGGPNASGPKRHFNIRAARSEFKPVLLETGNIVFREVTSYPNFQPGGGLQRMQQLLYAGDRQFRRRAAGANLVQRNARQYRECDEEQSILA